MRETWYKLEDGRIVHPGTVTPREDGRLVHSSGELVAMKGDVPHSWNCDPREMEPEPAPEPKPKVGYKTRESKSKP